MEPIALTVSDTTKATGFGKTTTYKLINEGKLMAADCTYECRVEERAHGCSVVW